VRISADDSVENAYLLNAIAGWVADKARGLGKPVVISCSYGDLRGGHDGNLVAEVTRGGQAVVVWPKDEAVFGFLPVAGGASAE
jgi:hypothetical protein